MNAIIKHMRPTTLASICRDLIDANDIETIKELQLARKALIATSGLDDACKMIHEAN